MLTRSIPWVLPALFSSVALSRWANADTIEPKASTSGSEPAAAPVDDSAFTSVEASLGLLTLPSADVCPTSPTECQQGETSLAFGIHSLYRTGAFGIGGGITWATTLRNNPARGADELERDHSRRYFLIEGIFRYVPIDIDPWKLWVSGTVGGVVVNDSWSVKADRDVYGDAAFVGPKASTLGTEGLALGLGLGSSYSLTENVALGAGVRYSFWVLPREPDVSPTGDLASLSGNVSSFDFSLTFAYRIPL